MLKINAYRTLLVLTALFGAGCASSNILSLNHKDSAELAFQNGQTITVKLNNTNPELHDAFLGWAQQGVYSQTPVYRQLPGVFMLTGKPRLKGEGYIAGPTKPLSHKSTGYNQIGLVIHADGSVGPELIIVYGVGLTSCCEAPQNIAIGSITSGKQSLKSVLRGDNLQSIAIQP